MTPFLAMQDAYPAGDIAPAPPVIDPPFVGEERKPFPLPRAVDGLSEEARAVLRSHMRRRSLSANTVVYFQDDPASNFYFIERGHVRLTHIMEDGSVALYAIIPAGASFGEAGSFDPAGYCDTATTIDAADVLVVEMNWIDREGRVYDELRRLLTRLISARHRAHIEVTRALYLPNLTSRLALAILRLLDTLGNSLRYQNRIVPVLGPVVTQRDLGAMARGTRENVNKILRVWISEGIVVVEDRHIILTNRAKLESIAFKG
jgi:CRP/FNR family transcriptional regulator, cyclic AMP receptor protein